MRAMVGLLSLSLAGTVVVAEDADNERERLDNSAEVLEEILNIPDGLPKDLLHKAECVAVMPSVKKFALGIGGSLAAARLLRSHLFATSPADPVMITSAAAILGLGALAATLVPARRASRTDPVRALRDESV